MTAIDLPVRSRKIEWMGPWSGVHLCIQLEIIAYTLTEVTSRDPVGWGLNTKEDRAIAPRRTITIVDIVAETLLTLA
jgi:hypothetical protein